MNNQEIYQNNVNAESYQQDYTIPQTTEPKTSTFVPSIRFSKKELARLKKEVREIDAIVL